MVSNSHQRMVAFTRLNHRGFRGKSWYLHFNYSFVDLTVIVSYSNSLSNFQERVLRMCCSILLVGDVRQHQAVEAGSPFEQLQKHGMTTVELSENVRQRTKLKQTVQKVAARHTPEAVTELISRGKVIEIADERERFEAIAQDYAKRNKITVLFDDGRTLRYNPTRLSV
jgi:ATP-dependent exoDNAse (exonuclease V) alpha subunit